MIELRGVEKTYFSDQGATPVLREISLSIAQGEFVAIVGSSGTGKTTLMSILGCLDRPTAGAYRFEGRDVTNLSDQELSRLRNRRIGFVFQLFHLLDRLSVLDNVLLPLLYTNPYPADARRRGETLLRSVGLAERTAFRPTMLSGGQQQRVAIARALINDPALVLADEPTGNLDRKAGSEILELFHDLHSRGRTIVLITHDSHVAMCAERIVTLVEGRVASDERPSERKYAAGRASQGAEMTTE